MVSGGNHPPRNPAPVSGPGALSKRTDGGAGQIQRPMPDMRSLGSTGVAQNAISNAAPLSNNSGQAPAPGPSVNPLTELFSPTENPNESITSGIDIGEGVGSSALIMAKTSSKLSDTLVRMLQFDDTGEIAILYQEALSRGD